MKIEIKERIEKIKNKEIPEGYRKIGDGVYPIDWTKVKMEEIFNRVNNPVLVEKDKLYQEIGIRSHGKGIFHKEHKLGIELGNKRVFWLEPDVFIVNIVFAWEQAIAKTTEKESGMIASHRFPMYKPVKNILDLEYITYYFKTKRGKEKLELASPGGAGRNKTLGQKEFDRLEIILPTIEEQEKISTILSKWDEGISNQEKLIGAKEKYKKGMIQKLFSQKLRFKDENGNDYPEWEENKLGSLINLKHGDGDWILSEDISSDGVFKIIQLGNVGFGKYIEKKLKTISKEKLKKINGTLLEKGDLLINRLVDENINVCILNKDGNFITTVDMCWIRRNQYFDNRFFKYVLLTNNSQKKLLSLSSGSGRVRISKKNLFEKFVFLLPSLPEQEKIANFLSTIDREIELLERELSILKNEKQSLMSMLLNGVVRTV